MSYHIRVQYIILYHIIYHIISYHIISYHISYHIIHHIISYFTSPSPHPTPPLTSPHDAMRYDTIQCKTEQYNTIKYLSQRPHPRAKTWHKIWMIGLHPNHDTIPILSPQNSQNKCRKSLSTYDHRRHLILALPQVHPYPLWMHAPVEYLLEYLLVKTSTNRNVDNQNVDKPKRRQTKTSTDQNVDRPKRRQTETSTNQNVDTRKPLHNS